MQVLLVDDEDGIRDGLAAILRGRGLRVATAASAGEARALLDELRPDVLVTDWRLADGTAAGLAAAADAAGVAVLVASGCPEDVAPGLQVLQKPVLPGALLDALTGIAAAPAPAAAPAAAATAAAEPWASLPVDLRGRLHLLCALLGAEPGAADLDDDGTFVTITLRGVDAGAARALAPQIGGDPWPVAAPGRGAAAGDLAWRFHRDGRPAGIAAVVGAGDPWPEDRRPLAVDLHASAVDPGRFAALLQAVRAARGEGREVHLLNVPEHLRLWAELFGHGRDLPMRRPSGPQLPAAARALWS